MALVYKKSDTKQARAYERSSGMEPNPGVTHLTTVNPKKRKRRRVSGNPLQWVKGRGQRHQHVSPQYESLKQALGWKKRHPKDDARLYPVDKKGTILSRPVSKKLLSNRTSRRSGMAYNIGALRRAMRKNPRGRGGGVSEMETRGGVVVSSPGKRRRKRKTSKRRSGGRARASVARNRSRRTSKKRRSRRKSRAPRRNTRRKSRRTSRRKSRAPRRNTRRKKSRAPRRRSRRRRSRAPRRNSRRTSRRRASGARGRRASQGRRRVSRNRKTKRGTKSRRQQYWFGARKVKPSKTDAVDKYLERGYMPALVRVGRSSKTKSGRPSIVSYKILGQQGRLQKKRTSRKRTTGKHRATGASYRGSGRRSYYKKRRSGRKVAANRRRSRRTSRRRGTKRRSRRRSRRTSRRPRRNSRRRKSVRRNSRRRRSRRTSRKPRRNSRRRSRRSSRGRRRRRLSRNMLVASKVRKYGRGKNTVSRAKGRLYQVVEFGPKSKGRTTKSGKRRRMSGYPVLIPAHVSERAYVRKYKFGGAAKRAHTSAKRRGYKGQRRGLFSNRRTSMRRNSRRRKTRRNKTRFVVRNSKRRSTKRNRRRRRVRKNQFFGADLMKDVVTPVLGGTAGFVAARVISNGVANVGAIRGLLDKDKPAADAENTKIAANVLGIVATLGLARRVPMIKRHQGALVTGMGLALTDRLLGRLTGDAAAYLSGGFGEYVSQPLGEYVSQPLGAYVDTPMNGMGTLYAAAGVGEYVDQPLSGGLGMDDPADQSQVDNAMNVMEAAAGTPVMAAAAGMGTMYATAGMGTLYAAAGLGAEEDSRLKRMYAKEQPPFVSIQTPTDLALTVNKEMPWARPVPSSLVTPEGRGYAGGVFARHLFGGMF